MITEFDLRDMLIQAKNKIPKNFELWQNTNRFDLIALLAYRYWLMTYGINNFKSVGNNTFNSFLEDFSNFTGIKVNNTNEVNEQIYKLSSRDDLFWALVIDKDGHLRAMDTFGRFCLYYKTADEAEKSRDEFLNKKMFDRRYKLIPSEFGSDLYGIGITGDVLDGDGNLYEDVVICLFEVNRLP